MPQEIKFSKEEKELIESSRVGRLATIDINSGFPHIIPICYVYDGKVFYTSLHKRSKRLRNIEKGSKISLLIDEYKEIDGEWLALKGIILYMRTTVLDYYNNSKQFMHGWILLINKYNQYKKWVDNKTLIPKDPDVRRLMKLDMLSKISWGF